MVNMNDEIFDELKDFLGEQLEIYFQEQPKEYPFEILPDEENYIDRKCPKCKYKFKIFNNDLTDKKNIFCPHCRFEDSKHKWYTDEQKAYNERKILNSILEKTNIKLQQLSENFSLLKSINYSLNLTAKSESFPKVSESTLKIQRKSECSNCGAHYAVIGFKFFCPICGYNDIIKYFDETLKLNHRLIQDINFLLNAIENPDVYEELKYNLLVDIFKNLITAFETFAKHIYEKIANKKAEKNAFQNIKRGNELWESETGKKYEDYLDVNDIELLNIYFQRRHIFTHNAGIVDEMYIKNSKDSTYSIGERLLINTNDVLECGYLIQELAIGMESFLIKGK